MIGRRSDMDFNENSPQPQLVVKEKKKEYISKFMLGPENMNDIEAFILKFYVDYEYPNSQKNLKSFWKKLITRTLAAHFKSVSGIWKIFVK